MWRVLVINCKSKIYERLCDTVSAALEKTGIEYELVKRNHDQLSDILKSKLNGIDVVVFSGSSPYEPDFPEVADVANVMKMTLEKEKYAFGVCFGLQMLAHVLDAEKGKLIEVNSWNKDVEVKVMHDDAIFKGVPDSFITRQYHNLSVPYVNGQTKLGIGVILARSRDGIEIMKVGKMYAAQFHPESSKASEHALKIFENYFSQINKELS